MSALVTLLAAWLAAPAPAPTPTSTAATTGAVHHILVLDDSGSMETDYDVHGFALAVPQLFQRMVGADHPELLTVLTLPQGSPFGPVPHLGASDYLDYPRDNGTYYAKSIAEAVKIARASSAARVDITLITDAEPDDAEARETIDRALKADPRIGFSCIQLGTNDPGDLCKDHTSFARDGFDMARLMATQLAASLGSVPRWGRLERTGAAAAVPIPLGRFVHRVHVLLMATRAGEDVAAVLKTDHGDVPLVIDHTRPMMAADEIQRAARTGMRSLLELPVGPAPRLALGTLTVDVDANGAAPELRLTHADGAVAWGVMLEYDLVVGLEAPAALDAAASTFSVRAHLTHGGLHVDDVAALAALGLTPSLLVDGAGPAIAGTIGADGWTSFEVPAAAAQTAWTLVARYTSATADLASAPTKVVRANPGRVDVGVVPSTPSTPTPQAPMPTASVPAPSVTPPLAAPTAPPISAWLPPTLELPDWSLEDQLLTYTLTVVTSGNKQLTGPEIAAQHLTASIVIDGVEVPMTLNGDRFEVTRQLPQGPTTMSAELVLRYPGGAIKSVADHMDVLPDAAVRLPATHDFGTVDAGCDVEARCQPLSLGASRALDRTALRVTRTDHYDDLTVTLRRGADVYTITADHPVDLAPSTLPGVPILACYAPAGCTDLPDDMHAELAVAPADARLATPDRSASTRLVARVQPSTWLACNLWWCMIVVGGLLTLFVIWGYVRPHAFPSGAFIQVADQERRLAKDPGRPLRSVPHGRRGFYRTATCAIDPSGYTVKRTRPHVLQLKADRGRIALLARGSAVERRVRGQWVAVDRSGDRYLLSGATYRVNQCFVFRVLA